MTTIRYFIPEDGDLETQPNVFLAPKSRHAGAPPSLAQIMNAFPVPGQYHFRFKAPLVPGSGREKGALAVWMDVTDERQPVPTWQGGIVVKVTRVGMDDDDDDDDDDDHHFSQTTKSAAPQPAAHRPQQQQQQAATRAPPAHTNSMGSASSADHIDLFNSPPPPQSSAVPPAPTSGGSLLDFDTGGHTSHGASGTAASQSTAHADFLGMTAPAPTTANPTPPPMGGMYGSAQQQQQQRPPPQSTPYNSFSSSAQQQQQNGGAFGGLGTPWK